MTRSQLGKLFAYIYIYIYIYVLERERERDLYHMCVYIYIYMYTGILYVYIYIYTLLYASISQQDHEYLQSVTKSLICPRNSRDRYICDYYDAICPVRLLSVSISEGLTQSNS